MAHTRLATFVLAALGAMVFFYKAYSGPRSDLPLWMLAVAACAVIATLLHPRNLRWPGSPASADAWRTESGFVRHIPLVLALALATAAITLFATGIAAVKWWNAPGGLDTAWDRADAIGLVKFVLAAATTYAVLRMPTRTAARVALVLLVAHAMVWVMGLASEPVAILFVWIVALPVFAWLGGLGSALLRYAGPRASLWAASPAASMPTDAPMPVSSQPGDALAHWIVIVAVTGSFAALVVIALGR